MKMSSKKITAIIASVVLACGATVGGTIAWLYDDAQVTNTFSMANVEGSIEESFTPNVSTVKEEVKITNKGDIPAYVRVMLTPTIMEGNDIVNVSVEPIERDKTDYIYFTIEWGADIDDWFQGPDGFWYYMNPVDPGDSTGELINKVTEEAGGLGANQHLRLDVSAQLIQADPTTAVTEAWDIQVKPDGTLIPAV